MKKRKGNGKLNMITGYKRLFTGYRLTLPRFEEYSLGLCPSPCLALLRNYSAQDAENCHAPRPSGAGEQQCGAARFTAALVRARGETPTRAAERKERRGRDGAWDGPKVVQGLRCKPNPLPSLRSPRVSGFGKHSPRSKSRAARLWRSSWLDHLTSTRASPAKSTASGHHFGACKMCTHVLLEDKCWYLKQIDPPLRQTSFFSANRHSSNKFCENVYRLFPSV